MTMRAPLTGTKRADGRWQIVVQLTTADGQKKRKTLYAPTQREVQAKAQKLIFETGRDASAETKLSELWEVYKAEKHPRLARGTVRQHLWAWPYIEKHLGARQVGQIEPAHVSKMLKALATTSLSGRSIQIIRDVLRVLCAYARELGLIRENPVLEVSIPVTAKAGVKPRLTWRDWRKIVEAEELPIFRDLWDTLGETGMRPSEALALRSSDLFEDGGWWLRVGRSKTEAGEGREIPVSAELAERLSLRDGWLFPTWTDQPISYDNTQRAWRNALKKAGIKHTNLYQLRKMRLSLWIAEGVQDDIVKQLAGHTDIRLTKNVYNRVGREQIGMSLGMSGVVGIDAKSEGLNLKTGADDRA